jgi:hypothetical protein
MKHVDSFDMPNNENPSTGEKQILYFIDYDFDLHDNYDLISQPCGEYTRLGKGNIKDESR